MTRVLSVFAPLEIWASSTFPLYAPPWRGGDLLAPCFTSSNHFQCLRTRNPNCTCSPPWRGRMKQPDAVQCRHCIVWVVSWRGPNLAWHLKEATAAKTLLLRTTTAGRWLIPSMKMWRWRAAGPVGVELSPTEMSLMATSLLGVPIAEARTRHY